MLRGSATYRGEAALRMSYARPCWGARSSSDEHATLAVRGSRAAIHLGRLAYRVRICRAASTPIRRSGLARRRADRTAQGSGYAPGECESDACGPSLAAFAETRSLQTAR